MCARYPPRWGIGKFARAIHERWIEGTDRPRRVKYINAVGMDVQIFGVKKNAETRKALRFFAERRMKTHFVDLQERAASRGELSRYAQKFGVSALIDEDSRRFVELGLRTARYGDERWLEILIDEPLLLKMPLVRHGNALTIGAAETTWKSWLARE
jgi:arsenate reductase-like glutaredoxin family protein